MIIVGRRGQSRQSFCLRTFLPKEGQCEIDSLDLAESSFSLGSFTSANEVVFDLGQSREHLRVDIEHGAPDAGFSELRIIRILLWW
ncbi:hypothetical protein [Nocardia vinacea]|uniref:hypothetical protein n=1 Tax=Nocardia vinacea TaxID=96468 RepID=UPI0012F625CB|nr:hypothetical protein [Nocardia vinacea]